VCDFCAEQKGKKSQTCQEELPVRVIRKFAMDVSQVKQLAHGAFSFIVWLELRKRTCDSLRERANPEGLIARVARGGRDREEKVLRQKLAGQGQLLPLKDAHRE
jgi:hypothetical protein